MPRAAPKEAHVGAVDLRTRLRAERSGGVVDPLRQWAYATRPVTLTGSSLGGAITDMLALRGAQVAAILYAPFESAKPAGVDPHGYVLEATRRAIASAGTAILPQYVT